MKRCICVIPARAGSKRIPQKNLLEIGGKTLVGHAVHVAGESGLFDCICVSSESDAVLEEAKRAGATLVDKRPSDLAADTAQVKDVVFELLERLQKGGESYDTFAVPLPTSPFRTSLQLREAFELMASDANYVMSLVRYNHPPQRAVWAPEGHVIPYYGLGNMKQTQRLEPLYRHDGTVFFGRVSCFLLEREMYGSKVLPYIIEEPSADIDEPIDIEWAKFLMNRLNRETSENA